FGASLTTCSRPSSRCTASTGLPGSYGTRPSIEARNSVVKLLALLRALAVVVALAPHQLAAHLLCLPTGNDLSRLDGEIADNGVSLVDDCHALLLSDSTQR